MAVDREALANDSKALAGNRDRLLERVRAILVTEFELEAAQVVPGARLTEDLDLDSIDGVTIVVRLEAQLEVVLSDDEIKTMATVGDIVNALAARLASQPCP